jgi:hypothetical protein
MRVSSMVGGGGATSSSFTSRKRSLALFPFWIRGRRGGRLDVAEVARTIEMMNAQEAVVGSSGSITGGRVAGVEEARTERDGQVEDDEQKNLKRELLHAQEEVKRIQSMPRARGEVDGGEGVKEADDAREGLAAERVHRAALADGERCRVWAMYPKATGAG